MLGAFGPIPLSTSAFRTISSDNLSPESKLGHYRLLVLSWFIDIEQMIRCILSGGGDCLPRGMGDEA